MVTEGRKIPKPLPRPENPTLTKPFWEGVQNEELKLQRCKNCSRLFFYPRELCPICLSKEYEWVKVSGRGVVYTFTVIYQPQHPAFREDVPYVNAIIQLDEGPRMMSNVVGCDVNDVKIGMPVEVVFEQRTPEFKLYKFKPIA